MLQQLTAAASPLISAQQLQVCLTPCSKLLYTCPCRISHCCIINQRLWGLRLWLVPRRRFSSNSDS